MDIRTRSLKRKKWPLANPEAQSCTIVDLFCGVGGLSLGAYCACLNAGFSPTIRLAVDCMTEALDVYRSNFGVGQDVARCADLAEMFADDLGSPFSESEQAIANEVGPVDIFVAGPPCQGHSDLNNSTRRNDPRNSLYLRAIRAALLLTPRFVLIENVPAVVHSRGGEISAAKSLLRAGGYNVSQQVVNFGTLGLAQLRKRHVILAVRDLEIEDWSDVWKATRKPASLRLAIADLKQEYKAYKDIFRTPSRMRSENEVRAAYLKANKLYDLPDTMRPDCHKLKDHSYVSMYGRLSWSKPAQTITSGFGSMGQGRFLHPDATRMLTPHEAARIQGFPDFFNFSSIKKRTRLQEVIGNAVPPQVADFYISKLLLYANRTAFCDGNREAAG